MTNWYLPLLTFVLIAGFTPGPNNIIAMSIGFNYGYKKVIPHIFGVTIGFPIMLLLIGFVIQNLMQKYDYLFTILKYISSIYLLYLSYKIATSPTKIESNQKQKPITFYESLAFQWINPKAWAGALATVTLYLPKDIYNSALIISAITSAVAIIFAISLWAIVGKRLSRYLSKESHIRLFNYTMAFLLLLSVVAIMV